MHGKKEIFRGEKGFPEKCQKRICDPFFFSEFIFFHFNFYKKESHLKNE
jgi:hypothetical protein